MITCKLNLKGISPYSQSAPTQSPRNDNEPYEKFEERVWREHIHSDPEGKVFIPPLGLKNCLSSAARFLGLTIPGKGKSTFTKRFESGVIIADPIYLDGLHRDQIASERLFLPSDGKKGGGRRVWKIYPLIPAWKASATIFVIDPQITKLYMQRHIEAAGRFIGFGRFRPEMGGYYGRFEGIIADWKGDE